MTVLIVLLIFAVFIAFDFGLQALRRWRLARATGGAFAAHGPVKTVAGFRMPQGLAFHPRHVWARAVDPVTVAVGIDDLAARLVARTSSLVLPRVGTRLRSGARGFRLRANGRLADLVSPVDGTVVAVNRALDTDPALCVADPYDQGWLCKVRVSDARLGVRHLLRNGEAARWMRNEKQRLLDGLTAYAGGCLADGGDLVHDFGAHLDRETWSFLVRQFLAALPDRHEQEDER